MPITAVLAGLAVADFDNALAWYERLFGRPADRRPMDGLAEWHSPAAGALQVILDRERAGRGLLTLSVDDLADVVAALEARGLAPGAIDDTTSDKVLIASISDPEGNAITLVQPRG
jgi:predicted enzyme related to lactoylglutathione lyase